MTKILFNSILDAVAKLACPEKSMILVPVMRDSKAVSYPDDEATPSGLLKRRDHHPRQKGDFNGRPSFAIGSLALLFVGLFLSLSFPSFADDAAKPHTPPFGIITGHKSGSHLIMKCVELLQDRTRCLVRHEIIPLRQFNKFDYGQKFFEKKMSELLDDTHYFEDHAQISSVVHFFSEKHPEFPWIVGIRDLRDAFVSQAYYVWDRLESIIGPSSLGEKITFLMNHKNLEKRNNISSIYHHAKNILQLLNLPNFLVVRFEDLVGAQGGGNDQIQAETIVKIANHIGAPLTETKLKEIQAVLFGDQVSLSTMRDSTFRSGKIGSWRNDLTPEHIKYFNKHYAKLQQSLGYSID